MQCSPNSILLLMHKCYPSTVVLMVLLSIFINSDNIRPQKAARSPLDTADVNVLPILRSASDLQAFCRYVPLILWDLNFHCQKTYFFLSNSLKDQSFFSILHFPSPNIDICCLNYSTILWVWQF